MHPLLDRFEQTCARRADRPAAADATLTLDYQSFAALAQGLAGPIARLTSRPRIGILIPTSAAGALAIFSSWYAGKTPVPLNFLLAPEELGKILRDAEIDALVTIERFAPAAQATGLKTLLLGSETLRPSRVAAPAAQADDLGALIYTSGTSGDPKGVCLSFENLLRNVDACVQAARIEPDEAFLSLLPQFHAFGFTANTLVPLLLGATVHYIPRFSPVAVVEAIAEQRISVFITIASMFGALAAMKNVAREQLASLRLPVSGGEPLPLKVAEVFEQRFGVPIYEGYGMTEASPVVTLNLPGARKLGSVGRPLPGLTVVAVDDAGRELPAGQEGQLVVRGHGVMQGYLNKPEATAAAVRAGGLWTGDIGHVDADGFVYITGRAKDMMIVGGENVFPFEIESVLVSHPAVAEAAVVGASDDVRGEVPVAFVILNPGSAPVTDNDLRAFCRDKLAGYKVPRQVFIREDLPRGPTGKILKRALQKPPASGSG